MSQRHQFKVRAPDHSGLSLPQHVLWRSKRGATGGEMPHLTRRTMPERGKIDLQDAKQLKSWTKALGVSKETLLEAIDKVGNSATAVRNELKRKAMATPDVDKPLKPEDFPVNAEGREIKKQHG